MFRYESRWMLFLHCNIMACVFFLYCFIVFQALRCRLLIQPPNVTFYVTKMWLFIFIHRWFYIGYNYILNVEVYSVSYVLYVTVSIMFRLHRQLVCAILLPFRSQPKPILAHVVQVGSIFQFNEACVMFLYQAWSRSDFIPMSKCEIVTLFILPMFL